jgi:hypothetical protein
MRTLHTESAILRKQFLPARQERTRRWGNRQESDFGSHYMGYVEDPSADYSLMSEEIVGKFSGRFSPK